MKEVTFTLGGKPYEWHYYTAKEIATQTLPKLYGKNIENLTYGELATITKMYNHGWSLLPSYVFEFKNYNETLTPNYKWFTLFCDEDTNIHQYTCYLSNDGSVELYDNREEICKFTSIDNMFLYMQQLDKTEPLEVCRYYNEKIVKDLESFDIYGIDGEIYKEYAKVFENGIDIRDLTLTLDETKCHEIKIKKADE